MAQNDTSKTRPVRCESCEGSGRLIGNCYQHKSDPSTAPICTDCEGRGYVYPSRASADALAPESVSDKEAQAQWEKAFRRAVESVLGEHETLRDRFAMAALTGIMARNDELGAMCSDTAEECYDMADAMLEARKRVQENGAKDNDVLVKTVKYYVNEERERCSRIADAGCESCPCGCSGEIAAKIREGNPA